MSVLKDLHCADDIAMLPSQYNDAQKDQQPDQKCFKDKTYSKLLTKTKRKFKNFLSGQSSNNI